jgi:hypothetical protein
MLSARNRHYIHGPIGAALMAAWFIILTTSVVLDPPRNPDTYAVHIPTFIVSVVPQYMVIIAVFMALLYTTKGDYTCWNICVPITFACIILGLADMIHRPPALSVTTLIPEISFIVNLIILCIICITLRNVQKKRI